MEERAQRTLDKSEGGAIIDSASDLDDHSLDVLDINSLGLDAGDSLGPKSAQPSRQK